MQRFTLGAKSCRLMCQASLHALMIPAACRCIQNNYSRIKDVERELSGLQMQLKLSTGPKRSALMMLRKKIELQNERVLAARERQKAAKKVCSLHACFTSALQSLHMTHPYPNPVEMMGVSLRDLLACHALASGRRSNSVRAVCAVVRELAKDSHASSGSCVGHCPAPLMSASA